MINLVLFFSYELFFPSLSNILLDLNIVILFVLAIPSIVVLCYYTRCSSREGYKMALNPDKAKIWVILLIAVLFLLPFLID